jgi:hypothetical protein
VGIGGIESADSVLALGLPEHHRVSAISNIRRTEPPAHLFKMPPNYTEGYAEDNKYNAWMSLNLAENPHAGAFERDEWHANR